MVNLGLSWEDKTGKTVLYDKKQCNMDQELT